MRFEVGVNAFVEEVEAALALAEEAQKGESEEGVTFERLEAALKTTRFLSELFEDEPEVVKQMRNEAQDRVKVSYDAERFANDGGDSND